MFFINKSNKDRQKLGDSSDGVFNICFKILIMIKQNAFT